MASPNTEAFYVTFTATGGTPWGHTNSLSDFWATTPWTEELDGIWECALVEVSLEWPNTEERLYLCCNAVHDSYINANRVQLLRNVEKTGQQRPIVKNAYLDPRYVRLIPGHRQHFRFYMLDHTLSPVNFTSQNLHCVLHFRPKED